ncbi:MAG: proteasome subunit beta [Promethearchaeota archaeon]
METNKFPYVGKTDFEHIIKTGTTTLGFKYKNGVIIATESQATAGMYVASRTAQKLFKINNFIAATISGGVADCQYIINQIKALSNLKKVESTEPEVKWVANVIRNLLFQGRSMFLALMIIGGYSKENKTGELYGIDLLGALFTEEKFLSYGSGSPYALGVLEVDWRPDLEEEEAISLAKKALTSAITRDAASGNKFQIVKITKDGFIPVEGFRG